MSNEVSQNDIMGIHTVEVDGFRCVEVKFVPECCS